MQLREMERIAKKEALLDPHSKAAYIREEKERQRIEELGRSYHRKLRALG